MSNLSLTVPEFDIGELENWANIAVVEPASQLKLCSYISHCFMKEDDSIELLTLTKDDQEDWPWFLQSVIEEDIAEDERSTVVVLDGLINAENFNQSEYRRALTDSALGTITQVQSAAELPLCQWYENMMPFDYVFFKSDSDSEAQRVWQHYLSSYVAFPLFKKVIDTYCKSGWIVIEAIGNNTKLYHLTSSSVDSSLPTQLNSAGDTSTVFDTLWRWVSWSS